MQSHPKHTSFSDRLRIQADLELQRTTAIGGCGAAARMWVLSWEQGGEGGAQ